jgi:TolA-binding protein
LLLAAVEAVAQDAKAQAAVRDFNAAAALQNEGLYARAAEKWTAFLQQYPADERLDRVHYYLGVCRQHNKQFREAADSFQTVAAKFPASKLAVDAQFFQAESLAAAGDPSAAVEAYKKVVAVPANNPRLADAYYALGTTQLELKRDADAAATFQAFLGNAALANHELANEVRLRLGIALLSRKKYDEADKAFAAAAAATNFANADFALLRQGQCRVEAGKHAEAAAAFADLVARFPQSKYKPAAQLAAGKCFYLAGKWDDVRKAFEALAAAKQPESPEAAYWLGRALLQQNKPQDAAKVLDEAVKNYTAGEFVPQLRLTRADAIYELPERRKEAAGLYAEFVRLHADHPLAAQALYLAAQSALDTNDLPAARQQAEAFLANPKLAEHALVPVVLYVAGEASLTLAAKSNDPADAAKAEQFLRQLATKYPTHARAPRANLGLAWALYQQKKPDQALAPLNTLFSGKSDAETTSRGLFLRGIIQQRLKQYDAAVKDLEAFLAGKPSGSDAHDARSALVLCRIGQGQFDQARAALDGLLKEKADFAQADAMYYELGHALLQQQKLPEAAEAFRALAEKRSDSPLAAEAWFHVGRGHEAAVEKATADEPKNQELAKASAAFTAGLGKAKTPELREKLQYKLGDVQFRQKQYAQAAATLAALLAERPAGELAAPARFLAAESHFRQDQFDKALPLFVQTAADKAEQYRAQSLFRAGTCAAGLKNWAESQKHFAALIAQFPKFEQIADARYGLALALQNQNKPAEARPLYEQVTKETETETAAKARFMLGELAFGEQKHLDAIEQFLTVATGYPYKEWQGLSRFEIARCHLALGNRDKAIESLKIVVEQFPGHAKAAEAGKMLGELKK